MRYDETVEPSPGKFAAQGGETRRAGRGIGTVVEGLKGGGLVHGEN
jgi:hypothetical protein